MHSRSTRAGLFTLAVAAAAVLTVVSAATAAPKAPRANARSLAPGMLGVVESVFNADAQAQINGGRQVSTTGTSGVATQQFASLEGRDNASARVTANHGFSWDGATTKVTLASITSQTADTAEIVVNVENDFHITGTPVDGSLSSESITIDPYTVQLAKVGQAWKVASFTLQQPSDDQGNPAGLPLAPPSSAAWPAGRSLAHSAAHSRASAGTYYPSRAVNYAATWWNGYNPAYTQYGNDCQNFVSQILYAGGVAKDVWDSWEPGYAPWINVTYFNYWAENEGPFTVLGSVWSMRAGDAFQIKWSGVGDPDHAEAVDAVSSSGVPLMTAHTNARWNYPLTTIINDYPNGTYWSFHPYGSTR